MWWASYLTSKGPPAPTNSAVAPSTPLRNSQNATADDLGDRDGPSEDRNWQMLGDENERDLTETDREDSFETEEKEQRNDDETEKRTATDDDDDEGEKELEGDARHRGAASPQPQSTKARTISREKETQVDFNEWWVRQFGRISLRSCATKQILRLASFRKKSLGVLRASPRLDAKWHEDYGFNVVWIDEPRSGTASPSKMRTPLPRRKTNAAGRDRDRERDGEQFRIWGRVALQCVRNNCFMSASRDGRVLADCPLSTPGPHEVWTVMTWGQHIAFRSFHRTFLCVHPQTGELSCLTAPTHRGCHLFQIEVKVHIRAGEGMYVTADTSSNLYVASSLLPGRKQSFTVEVLAHSAAIRSDYLERYWVAEMGTERLTASTPATSDRRSDRENFVFLRPLNVKDSKRDKVDLGAWSSKFVIKLAPPMRDISSRTKTRGYADGLSREDTYVVCKPSSQLLGLCYIPPEEFLVKKEEQENTEKEKEPESYLGFSLMSFSPSTARNNHSLPYLFDIELKPSTFDALKRRFSTPSRLENECTYLTPPRPPTLSVRSNPTSPSQISSSSPTQPISRTSPYSRRGLSNSNIDSSRNDLASSRDLLSSGFSFMSGLTDIRWNTTMDDNILHRPRDINVSFEDGDNEQAEIPREKQTDTASPKTSPASARYGWLRSSSLEPDRNGAFGVRMGRNPDDEADSGFGFVEENTPNEAWRRDYDTLKRDGSTFEGDDYSQAGNNADNARYGNYETLDMPALLAQRAALEKIEQEKEKEKEKEHECANAEKEEWQIPYNEIDLTDKRLGKGYFGEVRKAKWRGTTVAVKLIYRKVFRTENQALMFNKEVDIMRKIRHPNILQFLGNSVDPRTGIRYIVSEYMKHGSLHSFLLKTGYSIITHPLVCIQIALDVARGMCYMHAGNPPILHRDLTTNNILLDSNMRAKVSDFGLSKAAGDSEKLTQGCGTLMVMAPEVYKGSTYAEPADVYSFTYVLWELLTTAPLLSEGMTTLQFAANVALHAYRPPIPPECPPAWRELIEKCWVENQAERITFAQLVIALKAVHKARRPT